jgi:alpha-1,2-mannosyltransferase
MVPATAVMTALHDAREPDTHRHGIDLLRATGLTSGTLYPTLIRLQRAGFITTSWHNGRRTYRTETADRQDGRRAQIAEQIPEQTAEQTAPTERSETLTAWVPAILVAVVTAYTALHRSPDARLPDLHVYLGAVDGLRHGASLYDFIRGDAPFTYPPFAGLVFWPLTWPPTVAVEICWTLATIGTVVWLAYATGPTKNLAYATKTKDPAYATKTKDLALVLMLSAPVASDIRYGQVSLFLAAMIVLDVRRPSRAQGVLIGLAAAIKLTPLIFIPMLWVTGRRAAAITATATFAACGLLAAAALPGDSWRFWTTEMFHVNRLGHITSAGNQSLNGALLRLDAPFRSAIVLLAGGAIAALALRRASRLAPTDALIVVGAASIVLSPVSWTHHQIWLVLALLLPFRRGAWAWRAAIVAIMVLPVPALDARLILAVLVAAVIPLRRAASDAAWPARS